MKNYKLKVVLTLAITFLFAPALVGASARLHMPPNYLTANTGLVGYWTMDGNKVSWATGSVTDSSGQGNTGTIVGMATSSSVAIGKVGQALNFDGVNDYVGGINVGAAGLGNWTESAWIKTTDTSAGMVLSNRQVSGASSMSLDVGFWAGEATADGFAYYSIDTPNCEWGAVGTTNIANGQWHHILGVRESQSTYKIYVDGVLEGNTNISVGAGCQSGNASSVDPWKIGVGDQWLSSEFNGQIDEVRIYNRALSASEIQTLYKSGATHVRPNDISFVNAGSNATPTLQHDSTLIVTIPPTVAGNDLIVAVTIGDDPNPPAAVSSITAAGATFTAISGAAITNTHARVELWSARNIAAGITSVTITMASATVFDGLVAEYSGVDSLGAVATNSGASGEHPTISLVTQDSNHIVVAGLVQEGTAIGQLAPAITGTSRAHNYAAGDGLPDVPGALLDNTSAIAALVTNTVTRASTVDNWAAAAVELQKSATAPSTRVKVNTSQNSKVTNGLVGLWSFNGADMSGVTAIDRSGQGNNGTLTNGPTPAIGKVGQALSFDGVDDYVSAGDINVVDTATALSICVWVKHTTITDDDALVAKRTGSTAGILLYRDDVGVTRNDTYSFFVDDSADADNARVEGAANASIVGVWTHVCGTFQALSSTGLHLYVNGVEDANSPVSASAIGAIDAGTQALTIGDDLNLAPPSNRPFNGRIDEVRIYNRALSAAEIYQLYNMGR